jgi:DNA-binding response OmpR family regulator
MTAAHGTMESLAALEGRCILVLEDEAMICFDLTMAFEAAGAEVITARNVKRALSLLEEKTPDAAVLDVNLGHGKTCEPVAARLSALGVPFLLHSGDLHRHGELVETIGAKVVAKPAASQRVADEVAALLTR